MSRHILRAMLVATVTLVAVVAVAQLGGPNASAQDDLSEAFKLVDTWDGTVGQSPTGSVYNPAGTDLTETALYLVDRGNNRVQRFDLDGTFELAFGAPGDGPGELSEPRDVAVADDRVYVTDTGNDRIAVYDLSGGFIESWSLPEDSAPWGIGASGATLYVSLPGRSSVAAVAGGQITAEITGLAAPRGVDIGADGRIYIAEQGGTAIRVFSPQRLPLATVNTTLPPWDVAVDEANDLWVLRRDAVLWFPSGSSAPDTALYYDGLQGLAVSSRSGVFATVANDARQRHWVVQWAWRTRDRLPINEWRILAYPPGRVNEPSSLSFGNDGRIWLADAWPRVQSFDPDGRPAVQHVLPEPAVDVVAQNDGALIVGETRRLLRVMPDGTISGTARLAYGTTDYWLTALAQSQAEDRVFMLDSTHRRVRAYGITTTLMPLPDAAGFDLARAPEWQLYWDLAFDPTSSRFYAANRTTGDIEVYQDGNLARSIDIDGRAIRVAIGPDGAVFVLTLDGLVWKYSADAELLAAWDAGAYAGGASKVVDLTVDDEDRVYTLDQLDRTIMVWERDPSATPEPPQRRGGACRLSGDKRANPQTVRLGETTAIRLEVGGTCPQRADKADIVLVIDRSFTMMRDNGITATLQAAHMFIEGIDFSRDRVGVATFNSAAEILQPLTSDRQAALAALDRIIPIGSTNIAAAFNTAAAELSKDGRPDAERVIILLTDGRDRVPDDAMAAASAAKREGIRIFTIGFGDIDPMLMVLSASSPEDSYFTPDASGLISVYQEIARRISASVLLRTMTVVDELPGNMRFTGMLAGPAPQVQGRVLTWTVADIPFAGWSASYAVAPLALGTHDTNVSASATFTDGLDMPGRLTFPVPVVQVLSEDPTPTATSTRVPSPTPTPRPATLFLPITLNQKCQSEDVRADVVLVLDTSGSMAQEIPSGGTKLEASILAAHQFVDQLKIPGDTAGIVSFNTEVAVEQPLTSDRQALHDALNRLQTGPGTRIDRGIDAGREVVQQAPLTEDRNRVMILLTDGRSDDVTDEEVLAAADFAKAESILIFTIGLGADVDPELLQRLASRPEYYYPAPDARELAAIYSAIAYSLPCVNLTWP